jgi:hypothetical protein
MTLTPLGVKNRASVERLRIARSRSIFSCSNRLRFAFNLSWALRRKAKGSESEKERKRERGKSPNRPGDDADEAHIFGQKR